MMAAWHEGFDKRESEAWKAGWIAWGTCLLPDANPYPVHTTDHELWEMGWFDRDEHEVIP